MKTFLDYYIEVLDVAQRKKLSRRMKKLAKRSDIKRKRERSLRKVANPDQLNVKAQKQAKKMVIQKFYKGDYKELTLQRRSQIDQQIVAKKRPLINKIAKRLIPRLKKQEIERVKQKRKARQSNEEVS